LSEWFWDGSSRLYYYWYFFIFHVPHALYRHCKVSYFKTFSASLLITFLSPQTAPSIITHVPFSLSLIMLLGLLLGMVPSVYTCWFHNTITLPSWLLSTSFGTRSYQCSLSNFAPLSLHMLKCSTAHTVSCLFMYCSFSNIYYYYYYYYYCTIYAFVTNFHDGFEFMFVLGTTEKSQYRMFVLKARLTRLLDTQRLTSVAKCGRLDVISITHQPNLPPHSALSKLNPHSWNTFFGKINFSIILTFMLDDSNVAFFIQIIPWKNL
jgi:hypothetical protein